MTLKELISEEMDTNHRKQARRVHLLFALLGLALAALWISDVLSDPDIPLLLNENKAQWIRYREPSRLDVRGPERLRTSFRHLLPLTAVPDRALLTLRAMKTFTVRIDDRLAFAGPQDWDQWKQPYQIDLTSFLSPGLHTLRIDVWNENGPPALLAYCPLLRLRTDRQWEASQDGITWSQARPADEIPPHRLSLSFLRTDQALWRVFPLVSMLFLLTFFWHAGQDQIRPIWKGHLHLSPGRFRWFLMALWLVMAANNYWKLPVDMGMDFNGHVAYIRYLAANWRIPFANEGWQMFQPPLYYALAAALYKALLFILPEDAVLRSVKLLSLAAGAAQVEIGYRIMRYAYPTKKSLQMIGILLGGLLPMNLYISQSLGNEPLAAFFTSTMILWVVRMRADLSLPTVPHALVLGFLFGLTLLTKISGLLILIPIVFAVSGDIFRKSPSSTEAVRSTIRFLSIFLVIALIVSGWYYLRNWITMGRFFVGGWDAFRGIIWWQDPGYRTLRQCLGFGESLFFPVFSSLQGFWDALYSSFWMDGYISNCNRPPWRYDFMLSAAWLSLLPTLAIIIGGVKTLAAKERGPLQGIGCFCVLSVLTYVGAMFVVFLTVPVLGSAKATYALGLTPCFALLGTAGLEYLSQWRLVGSISFALFSCWAVSAYVAYVAV